MMFLLKETLWQEFIKEEKTFKCKANKMQQGLMLQYIDSS
jgi:hypothetical protein